ncbi:MAG: zinc-dependent metalloprotease, partial [Flavobacteriaceae bacterium]|nr:zinc-dependent metalloprotease [Flavobacteriaceae bacterium]
GGAHAYAHLWDNGKSATDELNHVLAVRKIAIANFSKDNIRSYEPYSVLEDVFVPLYFFHRYQTEGAVKLIGGLDYNYAVKGDGQLITQVITPEKQHEALASVLKTLSPEVLMIPEDKLSLFPPRASGYWRTRESFKSRMGVAFDALSASATASDMTLSLLLHPERVSRLIQQQAINNKQLGLEVMLDKLFNATVLKSQKGDYASEVQNTVNYTVLKHVMSLGSNTDALPQVRAIVQYKLKQLKSKLGQKKTKGIEVIYVQDYIEQIANYTKNPNKFEVIPSPKIPDGSPIGMTCFETHE